MRKQGEGGMRLIGCDRCEAVTFTWPHTIEFQGAGWGELNVRTDPQSEHAVLGPRDKERHLCPHCWLSFVEFMKGER